MELSVSSHMLYTLCLCVQLHLLFMQLHSGPAYGPRNYFKVTLDNIIYAQDIDIGVPDDYNNLFNQLPQLESAGNAYSSNGCYLY